MVATRQRRRVDSTAGQKAGALRPLRPAAEGRPEQRVAQQEGSGCDVVRCVQQLQHGFLQGFPPPARLQGAQEAEPPRIRVQDLEQGVGPRLYRPSAGIWQAAT